MRNKITDLNNHLFEQMERLNDDEVQGDQLEAEIKRSKAITGLASQIVANGQLMLRAIAVKDQYLASNQKLPPLLQEDNP